MLALFKINTNEMSANILVQDSIFLLTILWVHNEFNQSKKKGEKKKKR